VSHFGDSVGVRLGITNLWKLEVNNVGVNLFRLHLLLKNLLFKFLSVLLYYKIYRFVNYTLLYVCYFKYLKGKKWQHKRRRKFIYSNLSLQIKWRYYSVHKSKLMLFSILKKKFFTKKAVLLFFIKKNLNFIEIKN